MMRLFKIKDSLTEDELNEGLKYVVRDGAASQAMAVFTSGIFLVAFALELGASYVIIGLLAAIPFLANLLQIPGIYLIENYRNRRFLCVFFSGMSRVLWLLIALIPFLLTPQIGVLFLIFGIIAQSSLGVASGVSWNSWMRDLVPQEKLGTFFSRRLAIAIGLGMLLYIFSAIFIDLYKARFPGKVLFAYSFLFILGFIVGEIGVYFISHIPETKMESDYLKLKFIQIVSEPFKDKNYRHLMLFLASWNFAINLAAPFFTVYMLQTLEIDISFIIFLTVISQITNIMFLKLWGRLSERFSNKSVLQISSPIFLFCILAWTFTTLPGIYILTIPLLILIHIFTGISTAGVTLSSQNIAYKLAPKKDATSYLASTSFFNALAAGIAPILGGLMYTFFSEMEFALKLEWVNRGTQIVIPALHFQGWDFFFVLAFLIGLYSMHRLALVQETGQVQSKVFFHEFLLELRKAMKNMSSAMGFYHLTNFRSHHSREALKGNNNNHGVKNNANAINKIT